MIEQLAPGQNTFAIEFRIVIAGQQLWIRLDEHSRQDARFICGPTADSVEDFVRCIHAGLTAFHAVRGESVPLSTYELSEAFDEAGMFEVGRAGEAVARAFAAWIQLTDEEDL